MSKTLKIFVLTITVPLCSSLVSAQILENWTAPRNSYDVHACGPDRFSLGSKNGSTGDSIARFMVLGGDRCLKTTGERSEVVLGGWESTSRFKVNGDEGMEYYRVSVKLPVDWVAPQVNSRGYAWGMFFQLHGPNEYAASPAIAIHVEDKFSLFVMGGDLNQKVGGRRFMTRSDLNLGKWIDFVLKIKWAPDASGSIAAYRRDEGQVEWEKVTDIASTATLQYKGSDAVRPHYWKAGIYRSESVHENSLWLGPIIRGKTFEEVTRK